MPLAYAHALVEYGIKNSVILNFHLPLAVISAWEM
jgi:hypothetical protein